MPSTTESIITNVSNIIEKLKENKDIGIIYNFNDNNVKLKNIKNIYLVVDSKYLIDNRFFKKYIKYVIKLKKKINKKDIQFGILYKNQRIIITIIGESIVPLEKREELETCIKAIQYDCVKEKYEYIYDAVCDYLDNDNMKNNYCDFKNDVCVAKRSVSNGKIVTMGCCHKFSHYNIFGKMKLCDYFKNKRCSIKCITCKLFMCDYLKVKYRIKDITLLDCFFNIPQKIIIKYSFYTPKEKIIKKLLFFTIIK